MKTATLTATATAAATARTITATARTKTIVDMLENTKSLKTRRRFYIYTHSQTILITTVVY
jgi:hypothetical protein